MSSAQTVAEQEAQFDETLAALANYVPYNRYIGVRFDRLGDEVTARMPFSPHIIGNPMLPAIHGGVMGAFLEITAQVQLGWNLALAELGKGGDAAARIKDGDFPKIPKTIDITIDYLRSGRPRETFGRAHVQKTGRRVVHIHVEAWQDERTRPVAMLRGNFLIR
ncbi:PaaI family thioesterase [Rhodobacteraceae bacterium NNCM2]|nr:PaaI family thioesterase [Coraliihabitans acroporae]